MRSGQLVIDPDTLSEFCRRHSITRLSFFGSVLRDDFGPQSDVDVLVEFRPGAAPGFIHLARIERELGHLLGGVKVDLRTPEDLSPYFRGSVIAGAQVVYAEQ